MPEVQTLSGRTTEKFHACIFLATGNPRRESVVCTNFLARLARRGVVSHQSRGSFMINHLAVEAQFPPDLRTSIRAATRGVNRRHALQKSLVFYVFGRRLAITPAINRMVEIRHAAHGGNLKL
jgi:hypothetical protein